MPDGKIISGQPNINEIITNMINDSYLDGCGALVIFIGYVKGKVDGHIVNTLSYDAYEPYASKKLREIAYQETRDEDIYDIKILHMIGDLKAGDPTIYIFVTGKTREKAFETAKRVLERVKHEVPIFKLERRDDGEYWVLGNGKRVKRKKEK